MKKKNLLNNLIVFIPILVLMVLSLLNMKMIGNVLSMYKNYFFKQLVWFILGFGVLIIIVLMKPKIIFRYSKYFYVINVVLLILVLFFGKTINGSKAWFNFGLFSFQPSELMKFTLALYLSERLAHESHTGFKSELKFILKAIFITLIPSLFVFLEPDTGAIIIYLIILFGVILAYKIDKKWYIVLGLLIIIFLGAFGYLYYCNKDLLIKLIGTSFFYRVDRLLTFINNDSFQLNRALISIGTANFWGQNNYIYIPEAPTDFIVALSISNFGILGFIVILVCFLVLDVYFLFKLFKEKKLKYKMFYAGFIMMFIFAQVQNIGMNLGLLPIIGLPLPFLSYGGTNILVYFIFLGMLQGMRQN